MEQFQELFYLLQVYLHNAVAKNGFWDNVVEYWLPTFSMIVVIVGGIWTVYTYINGKNREINEKVLNEVYAPMYQFFVKNDAMADLAEGDVDYKDDPFLEWKLRTNEEKVKDGEYMLSVKDVPVLKLTRKDFMAMFETINIGLAPQELVTLISTYTAVNYAADETGDGPKSKRAEKYRTLIEYTIRRQAYTGYMEYCKKLDIAIKTENILFDVKKDCIKLKLPELKLFEENENKVDN